ncbi:MAG: hypothetical protein E7247_09995 [Paenibacillaceae bacterium]|nr:hypothetical protein [Paenibacillaceae bacterium]
MSGQYRIALYLRVSDEDENPDHELESESISSQRLLLNDFVNGHRELSCGKTIEFTDDGFSGTNFERPGVKKLLDMAKAHQIDCIVVKDFSRFGRNYLEVGNYLEQIFPFLGIRFLSVNDHFDSFENIGAAGAIEVGFKNIIHEAYSKDLSEKIKSVRRMKAEQGKFVTAFAPYGYKKAETSKNQLIIDEECAVIVRRIFSLFLGGTGKTAIACLLNKEGIPSPYMVRRQRNEKFHSIVGKKKTYWTAGTVSRILSDQRYTGDAIYGKVRPVTIGSKKDISVPEEDWIVVPDAHPLIVRREIFEAVRSGKKKYISHQIKNKTSYISEKGILTCLKFLASLVDNVSDTKENDKFKLYRRFKAGIITEDVFVRKIADLDTENSGLQFIALSQEMTEEFINSFHGTADGRVVVTWNFRDPYGL